MLVCGSSVDARQPARRLRPAAVRCARARGRRRDRRVARAAPHRRRRRRHGRRARAAPRGPAEGALRERPHDAAPRGAGSLDLSAVAALLAVPIVGFWPDLRRPAYLAAAVGGALLGMGIAALCSWRALGHPAARRRSRCSPTSSSAARSRCRTPRSLGVIPTLDTLRLLGLGRRHLVEAAAHDGRAGRGIRWPPHRAVPPLARRRGADRLARAARCARRRGRCCPRRRFLGVADRARDVAAGRAGRRRASSSRSSRPSGSRCGRLGARHRAPSRSARTPAPAAGIAVRRAARSAAP